MQLWQRWKQGSDQKHYFDARIMCIIHTEAGHPRRSLRPCASRERHVNSIMTTTRRLNAPAGDSADPGAEAETSAISKIMLQFLHPNDTHPLMADSLARQVACKCKTQQNTKGHQTFVRHSLHCTYVYLISHCSCRFGRVHPQITRNTPRI